MEEEVIDLREYLSIIKKKWFIMAILCVVCVAASTVYSFFIAKPVYQAETTLIVKTEKTEGTNSLSNDQVMVSQKLALTYGEIIKSRKVLDEVIKNLDLKESNGSLASKISVSTVTDTQIIKVSVQDTNKSNAAKIANEIPKVFAKEAIRIADANGVEVIDKAQTPVNPVSPNKKMNILIAGVLGVMIGLFIIFIIEFLNTKIKTPQDIEKELGLPLLGVIPEEL
ncbi:Wzz/FepE/Etk N-terminal domain-containing protein [uncultured Intestinibacter sp.]|uniref:YveK family protein n=1 Tax=uncultured Intestinibacter sp. TaxID=1505659 RepID=UPI0027DC36AB|nr:Wzz/FepE/Etk N-terminal domain-containing protein [uncultured Intestinibacter sp.]